MDKEDYNKDFMEKLHNLLHDQKSYNMNFKDRFYSWEEAAIFMTLELVEVKESLELLKTRFGAILENISIKDYTSIASYMDYIAKDAEHLAQESLHVGAVALKAIQQIEKEKAPTDGNQ